MEDRWLSVDEIAAHLGVVRESVYRWVTARNMPGHKVGRHWKFRKDEVNDWVKRGESDERTTCRNGGDAIPCCEDIEMVSMANLDSKSEAGPILVHETGIGRIYCGDSAKYMGDSVKDESVDLIITSPPFGLVRKKDYGNEDADMYVEWFEKFAEHFFRILKPSGSLVIDIGGAWKPGLPTRSLYHYELVIMLCRKFGFHLAQEFYWWNPAKLPTPAEWVNVRRVRVKDAVNCIWWLSKTPYPKASNRRVLQPYSESMNQLLENGYTPGLRPSGHDISSKFSKDNGGAIPPNLIALANTESNGTYQRYCRLNDLKEHPARFPAGLPAFFIKMLTDSGDLVIDPFAGSCVTGAVAEQMGRRWTCCELLPEYVEGAKGRFIVDPEDPSNDILSMKRTSPYEILPPGVLDLDEVASPLVEDGGKSRPTIKKKDSEESCSEQDNGERFQASTAQ